MKKFNSIDLTKLLMAIFVIAIHTELLVENDYPLYSLIVRSAVPFFFSLYRFFSYE